MNPWYNSISCIVVESLFTHPEMWSSFFCKLPLFVSCCCAPSSLLFPRYNKQQTHTHHPRPRHRPTTQAACIPRSQVLLLWELIYYIYYYSYTTTRIWKFKSFFVCRRALCSPTSRALPYLGSCNIYIFVWYITFNDCDDFVSSLCISL